MRFSLRQSVIICALLGLWTGNSLAAKLPVFVSILPQKYFVEKVGGDLVDVKVMVEPGAEPHSYEPKPQQMVDLAKSKIYFAIGVPFEHAWLDKFAATNEDLTIVHTEKGVELLPMLAYHHHDEGDHHKGEAKAEHDDKHGDHHQNGALDPHTWTSPTLVKIQTANILNALKAADPANSSQYETRAQAFVTEIDQLDKELTDLFSEKEGLQFMVFHPAWGYFAHDYGLKQIPVEIEGKEPKPAQLQKLIKHAREQGIKVIFVQPQFSTKSADLIASEIGGKVVPLSPLAEDWLANTHKTAKAFEAAVQ